VEGTLYIVITWCCFQFVCHSLVHLALFLFVGGGWSKKGWKWVFLQAGQPSNSFWRLHRIIIKYREVFIFKASRRCSIDFGGYPRKLRASQCFMHAHAHRLSFPSMLPPQKQYYKRTNSMQGRKTGFLFWLPRICKIYCGSLPHIFAVSLQFTSRESERL
jgi:hypothetical protein